MRCLSLVVLSTLILGFVGCSTTSKKGGGTAVVEFVHPEKYTDIELRDIPPERARAQLLPDLEHYIKKQARLYIAEGEQLQLRITDIDDAGWIRSLGVNPRRVVRPSQPARIDFEYQLSNGSGQKLAEGRETLSDLGWDRIDRSFDTEQLPLIKRMLRDWMTQLARHEAQRKA